MSRRGKHQTLCPKSNRARKKLEKHPLVQGVVLGTTSNCRHKGTPGKIEFKRFIPAGIKAKCYTEHGIAELFIYCESGDAETVRTLLD